MHLLVAQLLRQNLIDRLRCCNPAQPRAAIARLLRRRDWLALVERCNLPRAIGSAWAACASDTADAFLAAYLDQVGIPDPRRN